MTQRDFVTIVTPTGQVGRGVVKQLLGRVPLRLVARDPTKDVVRGAAEAGATICVGSVDDREVLRRGLDGARALFWLTPPSYDASDVVARYSELGAIASEAVRESGVPYVVHCSSFGAELDAAVGPIRGNRAVEQALDTSGASVLHLRPAYFMDNDLWAIGSVLDASSIFLPVSGSRRIPRIATRDVAKVAADHLVSLDFHGSRPLELEGPARVTFDEAAETLSRALGKPVRHVQVSPAEAAQALRQIGMTEDAARRVCELYQALEDGVLGKPPATPPVLGTTTLSEFARDVFLPAFADASRRAGVG